MSIWRTSSVLSSHQYIARAHIIELIISISLMKTIQPRQAISTDATHIKNAMSNLNDFLSLCQYCL